MTKTHHMTDLFNNHNTKLTINKISSTPSSTTIYLGQSNRINSLIIIYLLFIKLQKYEQRLHLRLVPLPSLRIISHSQNYPGKHQSSQPRTSESLKPLDPKAQFHLVIKSLGEYIKENILAGRGINYKHLGAFAFEVDTQIVKPAQHSNFDITKDLSNQRD